MHDVIVVGGGPAGLYTALLLAEEGLDVLVLEEHGEVGVPTHCTGIVSAEVHELYKIPETLVLGRPQTCVVTAPGGRRHRFSDVGEEILILDRAAFDQALAGSAVRAGAVVATGRRVDDIAVGRDGVAVATADGSTARARTVVLACGVTYRFHRLLGAGPPGAVLHTAQSEMDAAVPPGDESTVEVYLGRSVAPEGFAWLVPVRRDERVRLKAGVLLRGDARAHLSRFLERPEIAARLVEAPAEPVRRLLPLASVRASYGDRVLAVGDAAGLTKPMTGGGIFYSLLSAAYAADTLQEALRAGDVGRARLARYESRWRARLATELRTSAWIRRLFARLGDHDLDDLLAGLASEDIRRVIRATARFNWHRAVLLSVVRRPQVRSVMLRALFR